MANRPKNLVVKITTFVLFGLLIASFAVWGIGDIFRGSSQERTVAEIGGDPILQRTSSARMDSTCPTAR